LGKETIRIAWAHADRPTASAPSLARSTNHRWVCPAHPIRPIRALSSASVARPNRIIRSVDLQRSWTEAYFAKYRIYQITIEKIGLKLRDSGFHVAIPKDA
jgi:hypothetical protein